MPLLLLSSGARPRYLEDIVRALALPQAGTIQFRYEEDIVSPHVQDLINKGRVTGERCYLTYLDNRDKARTPQIVPVREAIIIEARKFGSSYIFSMTAERYVRTGELSKWVKQLESNVQDTLPCWATPQATEPSGFWVNSLTSPIAEDLLIPHDPNNRTHLEYFEQTVRTLRNHSDFDDSSRRLFFNVIRIADLDGTTMLFDKDHANQWALNPGINYRIELYHYFPEEGTHAVRPQFWIVTSVEGPGLKLLRGAILRIDSEYDWKTVEFITNSNTRDTANAITIYRSTDVADPKATSADLTFDVVVKANKLWNIVQAVIIGLFASLPGLIAVVAAGGNLTLVYVGLILGSGLAAGFASVFRLSRDV
jgi:hypothetical protein